MSSSIVYQLYWRPYRLICPRRFYRKVIIRLLRVISNPEVRSAFKFVEMIVEDHHPDFDEARKRIRQNIDPLPRGHRAWKIYYKMLNN